MPRSKSQHHKYARQSFAKTMITLEGKKIDLYALFYRGFSTGINYQKRLSRGERCMRRFDSYCPKCHKKFGYGDTVIKSKEKIECCNLCEPLQPLQRLRGDG